MDSAFEHTTTNSKFRLQALFVERLLTETSTAKVADATVNRMLWSLKVHSIFSLKFLCSMKLLFLHYSYFLILKLDTSKIRKSSVPFLLANNLGSEEPINLLIISMEKEIERRSVIDVLRNMDVGDTEIFPIIQKTSVNNTLSSRLYIEKAKGMSWTTRTDVENGIFKVTRTA